MARKRVSALRASGQRIDRAELRAALKRRARWQTDAWDYTDLVGEAKYLVNYRAEAAARIRLFAAKKNPANPNKPTELPRDHPANLRLSALRGATWPQREIQRHITSNFDVAGECYLVLIEDDGGWCVRSVDGVRKSGDVMQAQNEQDEWVQPNDLVRLWVRHPRRPSRPDSHMRGVLAPCENLVLLEQTVRALLRRRLNAGILFLPEEMSFGGPDPAADTGDGQGVDDPFLRDLMDAMNMPIQDPDAPSALTPMVVTAPGELIQNVNHILFESTIDEHLDRLFDRQLQRLAQGMNAPAEIVPGLGSTSHWNAWAITQDMLDNHLAPSFVQMCDSILSGYLRPGLDVGPDELDEIVVWFDASDLISRPNPGEDADSAHERGYISDAAARKEKNYPDEYAPDDEEIARRTLQSRAQLDPALTETLMRLLLELALPKTVVAPAPADAPSGLPEGRPPNPGPQRTPNTKGPADRRRGEDEAKAAYIRGMQDAAIARAVDRAGSRIVTQAKKNKGVAQLIAGVPTSAIAATLGPDVWAVLGLPNLYVDAVRDVLEWVPGADEQHVRDRLKEILHPGLALVSGGGS